MASLAPVLQVLDAASGVLEQTILLPENLYAAGELVPWDRTEVTLRSKALSKAS